MTGASRFCTNIKLQIHHSSRYYAVVTFEKHFQISALLSVRDRPLTVLVTFWLKKGRFWG
ncbi:MAG: hypothetical protein U7126_00380 [Microcoleus sp.]